MLLYQYRLHFCAKSWIIDKAKFGAIAGAIAEGFYGVPDEIWAEAEKYLDENLRDLVRQFEIFIA